MIDFGKDEIITKEQIRDARRFDRAAKRAFSLGLMNSVRNSSEQHMLINDKKYLRKLLNAGMIDKKLLEDLDIDV